MNKVRIFIFSTLFALIVIRCNHASPTSEKSFHVWGNCEKCKKTIEDACLTDGVKEAKWDQDSKLLKLKIDSTVTSYDAILKLVARSGYDNELFFGNDYAYSKLPDCCQYERRVD